MLATVNLIWPATLESYERYLRIEQTVLYSEPVSNPVRFISFDPCPAFVIVQSSEGIKYRCPRDEIYMYPDDGRGKEATGNKDYQ